MIRRATLRHNPQVQALRTIRDVTVVVVLGVLCVAAFLWDWLLTQVMLSLQMNDFGRFYYSARAFLSGQDMYAPSQPTDVSTMGVQLLNMNPPHFHLLILPLAWLEPGQALWLWMGLSVFALVFSLLIIGREVEFRATPKRLLLVLLVSLAFSSSQAFFLTGQLSLLMVLPMTICWYEARRGRWERAGVWLGACLSVKPFLLIFIPYLIGTRRIRGLVVTIGTAAACFGMGWLIFGTASYKAWVRALAQGGDWAWAPMNASVLAVFRRAFDSTPFFTPALLEPRFVPFWIAVAGAIGIATLLVVFEDETESATDRAFALLLVAAQLLSPLGWVYYLWLPAGPIAALAFRPARPNYWQKRGNGFLWVVAVVGLVAPVPLLLRFQPHGWATVTVGSSYFWATLAVWIMLLLDFARSRAGINRGANAK